MPKITKTYETEAYLIQIDSDHCIGCGTCTALASQTFAVDKNFKSQVKSGPHDDPATILTTAKACPTSGIILIDKTTSKKVWPK